MISRLAGFALFCSLTVGACRPAVEQADPEFATTDSSGIAIVEQRIDPSNTILLTEELRLGTLNGDENEQFFRVFDGSFGPDEDLWILDAGNHRVKVFGLDGSFRHSFGTQGSGPGEFEQIGTAMSLGPDVVVIVDAGQRIHSFGLDGTHRTTVATRAQGQRDALGQPKWVGNRWLIPVETAFDWGGQEVFEARPVRIREVDLTTGLGDVAGFDWLLRSGSKAVGSMGWIVSPLFHQRPQYVLDGRGRVHVVETTEYDIDVYGPDGSLERRVRNRGERVRVTEADVDAYTESRTERCRTRPNSECTLSLQESLPATLAMPRPEYRAVVEQLYVSAAGDLLVLRADIDPNPWESGDDKVYDLFAPDGRLRGRFVRPGTFRVVGLDSERIIAVELDELDVERIVVYRLEDPMGRP